MKHSAIYKTYPNVVAVDDTAGAFDKDGNPVELDWALIEKNQIILLAEAEAEAEAKAAQKAALLDRLGITEDEAKLLLA